jgi:putative oxygen-independent coproporphyrinogen III oxidase
MTQPGAAATPGLYIHIPFCRTKCPYCDFYSVTDSSAVPAYLTALDREAGLYREAFHPFDTLYLGGGTPSLLTCEQLTQLMKSLQRHFDFAPETEFTLEANPDDVTPEKLRLWRDLGVNRLSLGVQSLDEAELKFLGRRHTAAQARRALEMARRAGFANLSVDLIYGLPGQRPETWRRTLEQVLEFDPEHLSCYQLTVEAGETPAPRTPLARRLARGELILPAEEAQRTFFLCTRGFLAGRGYIQYEVSNFAREEGYCCRHNLKYWRHVPYLGLGPGAHSFDGIQRGWNFSSVAQYCSVVNDGRAPVAGTEALTPAERRLEALYLGFRTQDGVSLRLLGREPRGRAALAELKRAGLVRIKDGRAVATPEGLVVADRLPLLFTAP